MTQLILTNEIKTVIDEYKDLRNQIKTLEAQLDQMKKLLVDGYIQGYEEVATPQGLIVATYKKAMRIMFNQTAFKTDQPTLYDQYAEIKEVRTLLVK
jgi:hypothetical protein